MASEQLAGLVIGIMAGFELWLWKESQKNKNPKAKNHLIAGVLLGVAGLILIFASPA